MKNSLASAMAVLLLAAACTDAPTEPTLDLTPSASSHAGQPVVTMFMTDFTIWVNGSPEAIGADGVRIDITLDPSAVDRWGPNDFGLFDVVEVRVSVPEMGIDDEKVVSPVRYFEDAISYERVGLSPLFPDAGIQVGRNRAPPNQTIGDPNRIDDLPEYDGDQRSVWGLVRLELASGDVLHNPVSSHPTTACVGHDGLPSCAVVDSDGDGVPDDEDPSPHSDTKATVVIDGFDTGVANQMAAPGAFFADLIGSCAEEARNHGQFTSCVTKLANEWKKAGLISGRDQGRITSAAAKASIP